MIDIVQVLREQHPDLGPYALVLRAGSAVLDPDDPDRFAPVVAAWLVETASTGRLSARPVSLGEDQASRLVRVVAFDTAQDLARFATAWT